jgi:hypothetical protein
MTYFGDRMRDTFKLFIQLSIAVVGGFVWLKIQPNSDKAATLFQVARWIIPFLAVFMSFQIWWDDRIWRGYREAEATFFPQIGKVRTCMAWQERTMIIGMWVAAAFSAIFLR